MRLGLILSEVGQGFRRNLSMVVSVVLVTFISLTFFGSAILLQLQIGEMKGYWYDRAEVTVFMCIEVIPNCNGADATQEQIDAVAAQLEGDTLGQFVEKVTFETREDAFARFQEEFAGSSIVEIATIDSIAADFRIKLSNPDDSDIIIDSVSGMPGVDDVRDERALLQPIFDGAAHLDHDPTVGVLAPPRTGDHAARGRVEPVHRNAVHLGGGARFAHRLGAREWSGHRDRALLRERLPR